MSFNCDPSTLANAARCVDQCVPKGFQEPIKTSLLCKIATAAGPDSGSNFRILDNGDFRVTDTGDNRIWVL